MSVSRCRLGVRAVVCPVTRCPAFAARTLAVELMLLLCTHSFDGVFELQTGEALKVQATLCLDERDPLVLPLTKSIIISLL